MANPMTDTVTRMLEQYPKERVSELYLQYEAWLVLRGRKFWTTTDPQAFEAFVRGHRWH